MGRLLESIDQLDIMPGARCPATHSPSLSLSVLPALPVEIQSAKSDRFLTAYILAFAPEHFQAIVRGSFVNPFRDKMELERAAAAV